MLSNNFYENLFGFTQISPIETQTLTHEGCYYCQQVQQMALPLTPLTPTVPTIPTTRTTTTTAMTTLNVVINQQTIEQLIHNSLRKLFYPSFM